MFYKNIQKNYKSDNVDSSFELDPTEGCEPLTVDVISTGEIDQDAYRKVLVGDFSEIEKTY